MHDLDRTTLEIGEETTNFEFPEEFEFGQQESPFGEVEEEELAAQLLEITDESELDQFIGGLIKKVSKAARGVIRSPGTSSGWLPQRGDQKSAAGRRRSNRRNDRAGSGQYDRLPAGIRRGANIRAGT